MAARGAEVPSGLTINCTLNHKANSIKHAVRKEHPMRVVYYGDPYTAQRANDWTTRLHWQHYKRQDMFSVEV